LGGFKLKLVWFALLALLPLAVAFYGYGSLAHRSETRRADASLEAGLRVAVATYGARLDAATAAVQRLATQPAVQRALRRRNRPTLARLAHAHPGVTFEAGPLRVGAVRRPGATRAVNVVDRGRIVGRVVAAVPFDAALLRSLSGGLVPSERLLVAQSGRVVAGPGRGRMLNLPAGSPAGVRLDGVRYRALSTGTGGIAFVALERQSAIDAPVRSTEFRLGGALLASLLAIGLVTFMLGRSIVRTLRRLADAATELARGRLDERVEIRGGDEFAQVGVAFNDMASQLEQRLAELEDERARSREANVRFGEALAATHDPGQLVRVIVESAVEAAGAAGGIVLGRDGELARAGDPDAGTDRIAFPLRAGTADFGMLVVCGWDFDAEQIETVASLTSQAVVALENVRLHRIVERQALIDGLTGIANRRSLDDTLRIEISRATRFGGEVCLVLADIDDFKEVNDEYGHPAGDDVLRAFAEELGRTVREIDLAGRWGGEEFALILPGTDAAGGAQLAERARAAIEERLVETESGVLSVTASFGVASYPDAGQLGDLIAAADSALYAAKREGKNRVVIAAESISR